MAAADNRSRFELPPTAKRFSATGIRLTLDPPFMFPIVLFREFFDSWWPLLKSRFLSFRARRRSKLYFAHPL
jgi:hypothetical protein